MKNEKGISAWAIVLIIALLICAGVLWSKYYAKPMATVMMQGADQHSKPKRLWTELLSPLKMLRKKQARARNSKK
jgi:cell division septal protein FtsQ